jgi:hypothetical protein
MLRHDPLWVWKSFLRGRNGLYTDNPSGDKSTLSNGRPPPAGHGDVRFCSFLRNCAARTASKSPLYTPHAPCYFVLP